MSDITVTIYDESDTPIEITGILRKGMKGKRDEYGVQLEPDDDHEMEIVNAIDHHGNTINLTKRQERESIDALWEAASHA